MIPAPPANDDWLPGFAAAGYALLPGALDAAQVEAVRNAVAEALRQAAEDPAVLAAAGGPSYGARSLLRLWPGVVELLRLPALAEPIRRTLGPAAGLVRALYFDKPPGHSWALPWHRDTAIAVQAHGPLGRFRKPTVKAGTPHAEAPTEVLDAMATLRLHLDAMTPVNGPLQVAPGTHLGDGAAPLAPTAIHCAAGAALLMRPRLLHASGHAEPGCTEHRRIVHLEFAAARELPDGWAWHDFVPLP